MHLVDISTELSTMHGSMDIKSDFSLQIGYKRQSEVRLLIFMYSMYPRLNLYITPDLKF
jgi:hypothetical protein